MAGIGFELKKLFRRKGLLAGTRAYGYASVVCAGPMLLGVLLLLGVMTLCDMMGVDRQNRELLVCMITYTLLASLLVTSVLSLIVTRFIADMLFEEREGEVLPSFWGSNTLMLAAGCPLYGVFLYFSGATVLQGALCLWLFAELIVTWNGMSYLTAIKDYRNLLLAFVAGIGVALAASWLMLYLETPPVEGVLCGVSLGYGVMLLWDVRLLQRYFPTGEGSPWRFLSWAKREWRLMGVGLFTNIGLFSHLVIIWAGPIGVQVKGLFYGAPYHDVPALLAFLVSLVTTVNFVVSVEVNFYPTYHTYYGLFNDGGVVGDILVAGEKMLAVLSRELRYTAMKQLFVSICVIALETSLLDLLPLGFNNLMHGYFRTLCVGYSVYAVGNAVMLILLYFTDYWGAFVSTLAFALVSTGLTVVSLGFDVNFYGFGFLAGAVVFQLLAVCRLNVFTRNLPYRILGQQPFLDDDDREKPTGLALALDRIDRLLFAAIRHKNGEESHGA